MQRSRLGLFISVVLLFVLWVSSSVTSGDENSRTESDPTSTAPLSAAERAARTIPTKITGEYRGGKLIELRVGGRMAYIVQPTGKVDPKRR